MLSRLSSTLILVIAAAFFAGCNAEIRTAKNVTATSASLMAVGRSACGVGGTFHFEYSTSQPGLLAGSGSRTPESKFGQTKDACAENPPMPAFMRNVAGLTPDTNYYYRLCGRDTGAAEDQCTSVSQFTTNPPPAPMEHITASGSKLMAGSKEFRIYGTNTSELAGWNGYIQNPTLATHLRSNSSLDHARALGFNVARVHLQLFEFVERDANGTLSINQGRMWAFGTLLKEAEKRRMYLDIVGNNVWIPNAAPAWYDEMSNEERWEVQAYFFRNIAYVGKGSPAVFCYELTNEPAVKESPTASWYNGSYGGYHFTQTIARGIPAKDHATAAKAWMTTLRDAIRQYDSRHLITVGSLPFNGGAFAPSVQAEVLPLLSVHIYPQNADSASAVAMAQAYGTKGLPMFVGETSAFQSSGTAFEDFLVQAKPYSSGYVSFFPGVGPDDFKPTNMAEAVGVANSQRFIAMRPQLVP